VGNNSVNDNDSLTNMSKSKNYLDYAKGSHLTNAPNLSHEESNTTSDKVKNNQSKTSIKDKTSDKSILSLNTALPSDMKNKSYKTSTSEDRPEIKSDIKNITNFSQDGETKKNGLENEIPVNRTIFIGSKGINNNTVDNNSSATSLNAENKYVQQAAGEKFDDGNSSGSDSQIDYTFTFDNDFDNESLKKDSLEDNNKNDKTDGLSVSNGGKNDNLSNIFNSFFSNEYENFQRKPNLVISNFLEMLDSDSETWKNFNTSEIQKVLEKVLLAYKNGNPMNLNSQEQQIWTALEPQIKQKVEKIKGMIKKANPDLPENSRLFQFKVDSLTKNLSHLKENKKFNQTDYANSFQDDKMLKNLGIWSNQSNQVDKHSLFKPSVNNESSEGDFFKKSSQNTPVIGHNFSSSFQLPSEMENGFNQNQIGLEAIVKNPASSNSLNFEQSLKDKEKGTTSNPSSDKFRNIEGKSKNTEIEHLNSISEVTSNSKSSETSTEQTTPQGKALFQNRDASDLNVNSPKVSTEINYRDKHTTSDSENAKPSNRNLSEMGKKN